jgi:hypothetical protein
VGGSSWRDKHSRAGRKGSNRTFTAEKQYNVYWDDIGGVRRRGPDATLAAVSRSQGCALVMPFRGKLLLALLDGASGFPPEKNQLIDHCTPGAEGGMTGSQRLESTPSKPFHASSGGPIRPPRMRRRPEWPSGSSVL